MTLPALVLGHEADRQESGTAPEQQLDSDGRYTCGTFAGMTPAEVRADKRRFERSGDSSLLARLVAAAKRKITEEIDGEA